MGFVGQWKEQQLLKDHLLLIFFVLITKEGVES